jgi:hypothetical protein
MREKVAGKVDRHSVAERGATYHPCGTQSMAPRMTVPALAAWLLAAVMGERELRG